MALSRTTRVNLLISNGHFLSHFYVLCLPTMFLTWKDAFHVSFSQLGPDRGVDVGRDRRVANAGRLPGR